MHLVLAVALVVIGGGAYFWRLLWGVVACVAIGTAAWNWSSGAYSDSGNEIGFSILIVVLVFIPALVGAFAGSAVRSAMERRIRAN